MPDTDDESEPDQPLRGADGSPLLTDDPRLTEHYRRSERLIELLAAITLAVATILTAWSAFEASKWGGQMSLDFADSNRLRTESNRAFGAGETLASIDVSVWESWVEAKGYENEELASFFEQRFRDDFGPAFEAWIATDPLNDPDAPNTPFAMDEYSLPEFEEGEALDIESTESSADARESNQRGDNYTLTTVLFASVLFFAGISTKFESLRAKWITLSAGMFILVAGAGIIATFPVLI